MFVEEKSEIIAEHSVNRAVFWLYFACGKIFLLFFPSHVEKKKLTNIL